MFASDAIGPDTLGRLLCKIVRPIPTLKNVKDTINILEKGLASGATTGATMTGQQKFDNYKKLLLEVCQTYGAQTRTSKTRHCAHKVLLHQFSDHMTSSLMPI